MNQKILYIHNKHLLYEVTVKYLALTTKQMILL